MWICYVEATRDITTVVEGMSERLVVLERLRAKEIESLSRQRRDEADVLSQRNDELEQCISSLTQQVSDANERLIDAEWRRHKDFEILSRRNDDLSNSMATLLRELNALQWQSLQWQHKQPKALPLGSSIVRDYDENKLLDTTVISKPGGKIADATKEVAKLPPNGYDTITLVIGGNDCAASRATTAPPVERCQRRQS